MKVNFFHLGPQKGASTWLHHCLSKHPDVSTSTKDSIHYFDMNFEWPLEKYHSFFSDTSSKIIYDPTPSYIRSPFTPERISSYNNNAKLLIIARNPIERAFSHYWHEKKKDRFNFKFDECIVNYDLFTNWVEPGLYAHHYKRFAEYFETSRIKILFFDTLKNNPFEFVEELSSFLDIAYVPGIVPQRKINPATNFKPYWTRKYEHLLNKIPFYRRLERKFFVKGIECLSDQDHDVIDFLRHSFSEDIKELEVLTSSDLSHWYL